MNASQLTAAYNDTTLGKGFITEYDTNTGWTNTPSSFNTNTVDQTAVDYAFGAYYIVFHKAGGGIYAKSSGDPSTLAAANEITVDANGNAGFGTAFVSSSFFICHIGTDPNKIIVDSFNGTVTSLGSISTASPATSLSIAIFNNSHIYVASQEGSAIRVYFYDGTSWSKLGADVGTGISPDIAVDQLGVPHVAYCEGPAYTNVVLKHF
jgi:hypothetical protein